LFRIAAEFYFTTRTRKIWLRIRDEKVSEAFPFLNWKRLNLGLDFLNAHKLGLYGENSFATLAVEYFPRAVTSRAPRGSN